MRRNSKVRLIANALLTLLLLAPSTLWGTMAIWSRLPVNDVSRIAVAVLFATVMLAATVLLWKQRSVISLAIIIALWIVLLGWWSTILPSNDRNWQPDVAHIASAKIDGDVLNVENVRNFNWRSDNDFDQHWETRRYYLSQLQGADLFLSYWSGESLAHAIISFNFADSLPLAFSIEIRKEKGETYSATAGFFKKYELAVLAADERDIVKVRSTVRGEDVRIFRLDMEPATTLGLLHEYVALANKVSAVPRWYNTLTANCTTEIFGMAHRLDPRIRLDWRILLPGKLPSYLREREFISRDVPLAELVAAGRIKARAAGAPPDPTFSKRIREGVSHPAAAAR